jgi:hypothetical protein
MWCRDSAEWVYKLEECFGWCSGHALPHDYVFFDSTGKAWLFIDKHGTITVLRGYAWNGCTPKLCFLDLLVGTPDGAVYEGTGRRKTYYASLVHDALYQFLREASPLTRADADRFFLRLMQESDFALARVYWLVVRALGWAFWHGTNRTREWDGRRERLAVLLPGEAPPVAAPRARDERQSSDSPSPPGPKGEDHEAR